MVPAASRRAPRGPGRLVTLGSERLAFQAGHVDHADFGNVHGLCLHL